jgi:hypothetical protein
LTNTNTAAVADLNDLDDLEDFEGGDDIDDLMNELDDIGKQAPVQPKPAARPRIDNTSPEDNQLIIMGSSNGMTRAVENSSNG